MEYSLLLKAQLAMYLFHTLVKSGSNVKKTDMSHCSPGKHSKFPEAFQMLARTSFV